MAEVRFSIEKALSTGWNVFKSNWQLLLGAGVLAFVVYMVPTIISGATAKEAPGISALFNLIAFAVSLVLQLGFMVMSLNLVDGKPAKVSDLWSHTNLLPSFIGASILYALMVLGGTILLILPGIYIALRYQMYNYAVIDKKLGVVDSIKFGGQLGKSQWFNLLGFNIICGIIAFIASLPFGLGLIVALPVILVATASVYRQMTSSMEGVAAPAAPAAPQM